MPGTLTIKVQACYRARTQLSIHPQHYHYRQSAVMVPSASYWCLGHHDPAREGNVLTIVLSDPPVITKETPWPPPTA